MYFYFIFFNKNFSIKKGKILASVKIFPQTQYFGLYPINPLQLLQAYPAEMGFWYVIQDFKFSWLYFISYSCKFS